MHIPCDLVPLRIFLVAVTHYLVLAPVDSLILSFLLQELGSCDVEDDIVSDTENEISVCLMVMRMTVVTSKNVWE